MKKISFLFIIYLISSNLFAQNLTEIKTAKDILSKRGEVIIEFSIKEKSELSGLIKLMSIDQFDNNLVTAYLNEKQFEYFKELNYNFKTIEATKEKASSMATTVAEMANWDKYPTYEVYVQMMTDFATNYPSICKLETIGTSVNGRELLAVKISDNVNENEAEPEFFYTSTMHGDETTGFVLMLQLIDNLLTGYNPLAKTNNIVDNYEIYINPLANPDGTYYGGNTTVFSATRSNANSVDLNRNFPDPRTGENPDSYAYQAENLAMMQYASNHNFVMSANFHGGVEVINYPWDTWYNSEHTHADESWLLKISTDYALSAQNNSPAGYMDFSGGVTNGADWYQITGGRQDYMTYFQHCREVTMEISDVKLLASSNFPAYWTYNKEAFINYILEANYGINGLVTEYNGTPIHATVKVLNHDVDNSFVYSDATNGDYYRPIASGVYDLEFSADGYESKTIYGIEAIDGQTTVLNVVLQKTQTNIEVNTKKRVNIYPNPVKEIFKIEYPSNSENIVISILDISGSIITKVNLDKQNTFQVNVSHLAKGSYICKVTSSESVEFIKFIKQ